MDIKLVNILLEQTGVPTKKILNADEWNDFNYEIDKRKPEEECTCTKQTKGGKKNHLDAHKKVGKRCQQKSCDKNGI